MRRSGKNAAERNMEKSIYRYRVHLDSVRDVLEFVRIATKTEGHLELVNGRRRLSATSFLSVALARISWDEVILEADYDCYFDFENFIA